jgi:hypothetical protein
MGNLFYGTTTEPLRVPDRLLSHVKVVTATKLRRSESFTLTWAHTDGTPGRTTLWLQPSIPLRFVFDSAEPESLDSATLKAMADMANSSAGLVIDLDAVIPTQADTARIAPRVAAPAARRTLTKAA